MGVLALEGYVKQGLRIASGSNPDPELELNNTIFKQKPFFLAAKIPNMETIYDGTTNLCIAPWEFRIHRPDYVVTCEWHPGLTETFWLVSASIEFKNKIYSGYVYYPCPSPVKSHKDDTVELLTEKIESLHYGDPLIAYVSDKKIGLVRPDIK